MPVMKKFGDLAARVGGRGHPLATLAFMLAVGGGVVVAQRPGPQTRRTVDGVTGEQEYRLIKKRIEDTGKIYGEYIKAEEQNEAERKTNLNKKRDAHWLPVDFVDSYPYISRFINEVNSIASDMIMARAISRDDFLDLRRQLFSMPGIKDWAEQQIPDTLKMLKLIHLEDGRLREVQTEMLDGNLDQLSFERIRFGERNDLYPYALGSTTAEEIVRKTNRPQEKAPPYPMVALSALLAAAAHGWARKVRKDRDENKKRDRRAAAIEKARSGSQYGVSVEDIRLIEADKLRVIRNRKVYGAPKTVLQLDEIHATFDDVTASSWFEPELKGKVARMATRLMREQEKIERKAGRRMSVLDMGGHEDVLPFEREVFVKEGVESKGQPAPVVLQTKRNKWPVLRGESVKTLPPERAEGGPMRAALRSIPDRRR